MTRLHIVLRQSPDWKRLTPEEFRAQSRTFCRMLGMPDDHVIRTADLWNAHCRLGFTEVRQTLKDIAAANLAECGADRMALADLHIDAIQPDDLYLFTDDDDWLDPLIEKKLSAPPLTGQERGVVWGAAAFGTHRPGKILRLRPINGLCSTNNYAVTGHALARTLGTQASPVQHFHAHGLMSEHVRLCEGYFSVANKSPASTVHLNHALAGEFSDRVLSATIRGYLERCSRIHEETPGHLQWAIPLMEKTAALFAACL